MVQKSQLEGKTGGILRYTAGEILNAFGFDLENAIKNEIEFLQNAKVLEFLENEELIENAVRRYETIWLPLMNSNSMAPQNLIPPLDVHIVWRAHMLAPGQYQKDCLQWFGRLLDHQILPLAQLADNEKSKAIWNAFCPEEPFEWGRSLGKEVKGFGGNYERKSGYDLMDGAKQQIKFIKEASELPNLLSAAFVPNALGAYVKFLQLAATYPHQNLTPTVPIDIVWHTHQMHPKNYAEDCINIFGAILLHDNGMETSELIEGDNMTKALWFAHFQENQDSQGNEPPCGTGGNGKQLPPCGTGGNGKQLPPCGTGGNGKQLPPCGTAGGKMPPCGTAGGKMPPCGTAGGKMPPCGTAGGKMPPCGTAGGKMPPCGTAGGKMPPCGIAGFA